MIFRPFLLFFDGFVVLFLLILDFFKAFDGFLFGWGVFDVIFNFKNILIYSIYKKNWIFVLKKS